MAEHYDYMECPYCCYKVRWDVTCDPQDGEAICSHCGETFLVEVEAVPFVTTKKKRSG